MKTKEIMCCADFERIFNVRVADKCCATCKHSKIEFEGDATCKHPKRNDTGYMVKKDSILPYRPFNVMHSNVCDLWEVKGKTND